ncbi:MAG: hypothetical protein ABEJ85_05515 [Haloarculaceae archaeon]
MALYALDDIDDAIDATRRFLLPLDRVRWARLAVVMFFVTLGGVSIQIPYAPVGGFGPGAGTDAPEMRPDVSPDVDITPELTPELVALILGVLALLLVLAVGYWFVSAVMEFVFVASLRAEEVRLATFARENLGRGLRLFAFRLAVWLLTVGGVAATVLGTGAAMGGWPPTAWSGGTLLGVALVAVPLALVAVLVVGNLLGFTRVFVVPIMLAEDRGVLDAWRRLWPTLVGQWKQFLVYAVAGFLLSIGVAIATGILIVAAAIALAIPFVVVAAIAVLSAGLGGIGGLVVLVLAVMYVLLVLVVALVVQVPFQTFLRYYALLVLGDANEDFDVVPDARAAVRATDGFGAADATPGAGDSGRGDSLGGDREGGRERGRDESGDTADRK